MGNSNASIDSTHSENSQKSNRKSSKSAQINQELVNSVLAGIQKLVSTTEFQSQKDIASNLDEHFLMRTLLNLSMKAGLKTYNQNTDEYKDQQSMIVKTVVQAAMHEEMTPLFVKRFGDLVKTHSGSSEASEKQLIFQKIKNEVKIFIKFGVEVFRLISSNSNVDDLENFVKAAVLNPNLSTVTATIGSSKVFIAYLYNAYRVQNEEYEEICKKALPRVEILELADLREVKESLKRSKFYEAEKLNLSKIFGQIMDSGDLNRAVRGILGFATRFYNEVQKLKTWEVQGADLRFLLNVYLIVIFNQKGLFSLSQLVSEIYEGIIDSQGFHLMCTIHATYKYIDELFRKKEIMSRHALENTPSPNLTEEQSPVVLETPSQLPC